MGETTLGDVLRRPVRHWPRDCGKGMGRGGARLPLYLAGRPTAFARRRGVSGLWMTWPIAAATCCPWCPCLLRQKARAGHPTRPMRRA